MHRTTVSKEMRPARWPRWILALGLLLALAGAGAPTAAADDTTVFYEDDVSTGGGSTGPLLAPVGYWTCHHTLQTKFNTTNHTAWNIGSNGCNHNVQRMTGQVFLERPQGNVLAASTPFDCSDCATRTRATPPYPIASGVTYWYRFDTEIDLPYGQVWDTYPAGDCIPSNERLICSFKRSFVVNY